jgi:hypothetical protein
MGNTPAKMFPSPTPYGQSPATNTAAPDAVTTQPQSPVTQQPGIPSLPQPIVMNPFSTKQKLPGEI